MWENPDDKNLHQLCLLVQCSSSVSPQRKGVMGCASLHPSYGLAGGRENLCKRSPQRHREHGEKKEGCGNSGCNICISCVCSFTVPPLCPLCLCGGSGEEAMEFLKMIDMQRGLQGRVLVTHKTDPGGQRKRLVHTGITYIEDVRSARP